MLQKYNFSVKVQKKTAKKKEVFCTNILVMIKKRN